MATTKEEEYLTLSQAEALITDIVGKAYSRSREDTTKEINGAIKSNINPLTDSLSNISKQLEVVQQLTAKVESTDSQMKELFTALQAPDEDPTQPTTPQAINIDEITAKIKAEIEESSAKTYLDRIQKLETGIQEERLEKEKIRQEQIESDRKNNLLGIIKKVAPELNLFPDHEEVVMEKLALKDKVLQVSEDGTSWVAKIKRPDPFTKQVEDAVVPLTDEVLKSIISGSYSYYQLPRAGAGVNAAPTQSYSPANRKITDNTTASDIQTIMASNDKSGIDEIAAMIVAQGG
jgi:hypothetical protein